VLVLSVVRNLDETVLRITSLSFFSCTDRAMHKKRIHVMKFSQKLGVTLAALAALGLAVSNAAKADAGFQINGATGTLYTGTNALLSTPFTAVAGTGGTVNGITLAVSNTGAASGNQPGAGGGVGTADQALVYDGYDVYVTPAGNTPPTLTFSGLTAGASYNVALYGSNDPSGWALGAGAPAPTVTAPGFAVPAYSIANSSGLFSNVVASGTGTIVIQAFVPNGNASEFAGAQIAAAVPEASSAIGFGVLLSLGGLAVVARKRIVKA
jgi:hypothetical protein